MPNNWVQKYATRTKEKTTVTAKKKREVRHKKPQKVIYRKTSNIKCTLVGNKIVDHSDVVGASPVGAAPTTSSFLT